MEIKDVEHARKVLWASLLEYGVVIDSGRDDRMAVYRYWSQYGGYWLGGKIAEVLNVETLGQDIDWEHCGIPEYVTVGAFVGTDSPNEQTEAMIGKLQLKDGSVHYIAADKVTDMMRACVDALRKNSLPQEPDLVAKWNL